jgi:hypothetical protein
MATIVHLFKSYRSIFLFEFLELCNLAFGPNQSWISFEIEIEFQIHRAHPSASPLSPLSRALLQRLISVCCRACSAVASPATAACANASSATPTPPCLYEPKPPTILHFFAQRRALPPVSSSHSVTPVPSRGLWSPSPMSRCCDLASLLVSAQLCAPHFSPLCRYQPTGCHGASPVVLAMIPHCRTKPPLSRPELAAPSSLNQSRHAVSPPLYSGTALRERRPWQAACSSATVLHRRRCKLVVLVNALVHYLTWKIHNQSS